MRTSKFLLATSKQTPADAEIISHQLMLRAGLVRKLASGLYNWLPTGLRIIQKISNIVREEMNKSGALELLMPVTQPADLWQESGRFEQYGAELLKFTDRHQRDFVLGPTHEEVITDIARREIKSYKQLPLCLYQIQTKFRDEIRPRFGVMRSREFIMKDAYSFHIDQQSLDATYQIMHQTYCRIFTRCGLNYRVVVADSGSIGGSKSHEFHVLADAGEDSIAFSNGSDYAANIEMAVAIKPGKSVKPGAEAIKKISTPNVKTINAVADLLGISPKRTVKTLIVTDANQQSFAVILRGDHQLNEFKLNNMDFITAPIAFVDDSTIAKYNLTLGSIGPVNLDLPIIVDHSAAVLNDFVCGANQDEFHFVGVNWGRDVELSDSYDIRNVVNGDSSPDKQGKLKIAKGIEVGHIFQLGNKYSQKLKAEVLTETGTTKAMIMGCYGIGVTRIVAASIEQNHDSHGIIWTDEIAPFAVCIVPINFHKSEQVRQVAEKIYHELLQLGIEVLLDDRNERPGLMFADMELIGIPHRITIGERSLSNNKVEYKHRQVESSSEIELEQIIAHIKQIIAIPS